MTRDERDIAKRWCILNCWGWPPDLPKPELYAERHAAAKAEMGKAVRAIGLTKCLEYWNSEEFKAIAPVIVQEWGLNAEAQDAE
jgi:hypothetical protein